MRILLLEPWSEMQETLKKFLEFHGHEVISIDNPVSAYGICTTFDVQLLISEYDSKNPDYFGLFELINAKKLRTKIIILTATPYTLNEISNLHEIGIDCVFEKPIDPEIILKSIQEFEKKLQLQIKTV